MPKTHNVQQGDTISSISFKYGLFPDTIWSHPDNDGLRKLRKDPNVLLPGDKVIVPDRRIKPIGKPTDGHHRFRRRGVPMIFRVQLLRDGGQPRANVSYSLDVEGKLLKGATSSEGVIEHWVSPSASKATLRIGEDVYKFAIGSLDPETTDKGVRARLANLGYLDHVDGSAKDLAAALRAFQADLNLKVTGQADDATRDELKKAHQS